MWDLHNSYNIKQLNQMILVVDLIITDREIYKI